jgi:hypothetical protein
MACIFVYYDDARDKRGSDLCRAVFLVSQYDSLSNCKRASGQLDLLTVG